MDPISAAIIATVTAGVKDIGKKTIVDSYNGLKNWIVKKCGSDAKVTQALVEVEETPNSKARQMVLEEEMGKAKIANEPELQKLAEALVAALKDTNEGRQATAKFQVDAKGAQVGVMGDHAKVDGGIHFGEK